MAKLRFRSVTLRNGETIQIGTAQPSHAVGCGVLRDEIVQEGNYGTVASIHDPREDDVDRRRRFERDAADPGIIQLVAVRSDGRVIGEARCAAIAFARVRHVARISIAIAADSRGRGLGEAIMRVIIEWTTAHPEIARLTLAVFAPNVPARRLYEKLGFVVEGVRVGEIRLAHDRYADDLIMARWVKDPPTPDQFVRPDGTA